MPSPLPAEPRSSLEIEDVVRALYAGVFGRQADTDGLRFHAEGLALGGDLSGLIGAMLASPEFTKRAGAYVGELLPNRAPAQAIQTEVSDSDRAAMWERIARTWAQFGDTDPYWSVVTDERWRADQIGATGALDAFYATGEQHVGRLDAWLARNGVALTGHETCVEYGCGVGRVTMWLARRFERVVAFDISAPHIAAARARLGAEGVTNVDFVQVRSETDLKAGMKGADLFFSEIVLQHSPPPVAATVLETAFKGLRRGGLAFFQALTYRKDYSFSARTYLASTPVMEMNALPQRVIFERMERAGLRPLEVTPDTMTGGFGEYVSTTFLARKS